MTTYKDLEVSKSAKGWILSSTFWRLEFTSELHAKRAKEIIENAHEAGRENLREELRSLLGAVKQEDEW